MSLRKVCSLICVLLFAFIQTFSTTVPVSALVKRQDIYETKGEEQTIDSFSASQMVGSESREYIPSNPEVIVKTKLQVESFVCTDSMDVPKIECEALVALYNSTTGAGWDRQENWLTTTTIGNWQGVTVSDGHVIELILPSNQLSGPIPPELASLANLLTLQLSFNQLTGSIPSELGSLTNLETLDFIYNYLTGGIPTFLASLSQLKVLDLGVNQLTGPIPPELGNMTSLLSLTLGVNQLSGSIPPELGGLENLQYLDLYNSQLTGTIPPELGNLTNLQRLYLNKNQLSGTLPPEMSDLSNLWALYISDNPLDGPIPWLFLRLSKLLYFEFINTDLCEPPDLGFQIWKATVPVWQGNGNTCQTRSSETLFLPMVRNGPPCTRPPILQEPANGANLDTLIPVIKWDDSVNVDATDTHLEIALDPNFEQIVDSYWGIGTNRFHAYRPITNFEPATKLYWRSYSVCGETKSPYSQTWTFTTGSGGTILPAPILISPADDSLLTVPSPELVWSAVDGAVEYMYHHTPAGQGGYMFIRTTETSATFFCGGLTPNTTYDWWVKARNEYAWGENAERWQFTTPAETQSLSQEHFSPINYVDQDGKVITSE